MSTNMNMLFIDGDGGKTNLYAYHDGYAKDAFKQLLAIPFRTVEKYEHETFINSVIGKPEPGGYWRVSSVAGKVARSLAQCDKHDSASLTDTLIKSIVGAMNSEIRAGTLGTDSNTLASRFISASPDQWICVPTSEDGRSWCDNDPEITVKTFGHRFPGCIVSLIIEGEDEEDFLDIIEQANIPFQPFIPFLAETKDGEDGRTELTVTFHHDIIVILLLARKALHMPGTWKAGNPSIFDSELDMAFIGLDAGGSKPVFLFDKDTREVSYGDKLIPLDQPNEDIFSKVCFNLNINLLNWGNEQIEHIAAGSIELNASSEMEKSLSRAVASGHADDRLAKALAIVQKTLLMEGREIDGNGTGHEPL